MLNNENYITVQGWMVKELGLKGNKLLTYALIYGFSQDSKSEFTGSLSYIADWVGVTKRAAIDIINDLIDKKLIEKIEHTAGNVKYYSYKITSVKNFTGGEEISPGGSEKTSPQHIYIINNNNTPPIIPPQGEEKLSFIDLWNRFADLYTEDYPGNQPIARIKSTTEIPNLGTRTKELNKLVKDLLSCDPDNVIRQELEKRNNDVWYWAFAQIWRKIKKSRFLRGECPTTEAHPKPFRFNVQFLMRKQNFIRMVSPNDTAFLD